MIEKFNNSTWIKIGAMLASLWTFIGCTIYLDIWIVEILLYYVLLVVATSTWVNYVKSEAVKIVTFGFCTFICVMVSIYVFAPANAVVVALMSVAAQSTYMFLVKLNEVLK